jgi:hypothetical protein
LSPFIRPAVGRRLHCACSTQGFVPDISDAFGVCACGLTERAEQIFLFLFLVLFLSEKTREEEDEEEKEEEGNAVPRQYSPVNPVASFNRA